MIPVLIYPDGDYHNDSTILIADLEAEHTIPNHHTKLRPTPDNTFRPLLSHQKRHSERPTVPCDPVAAFLAALIEDFSDEWLTKAMFEANPNPNP